MSASQKKDVGRRRQAASKPGVRIRAVRRSKPDVQRLAQALIEIAMSQASPLRWGLSWRWRGCGR